jgi:hypothetical protein
MECLLDLLLDMLISQIQLRIMMLLNYYVRYTQLNLNFYFYFYLFYDLKCLIILNFKKL